MFTRSEGKLKVNTIPEEGGFPAQVLPTLSFLESPEVGTRGSDRLADAFASANAFTAMTTRKPATKRLAGRCWRSSGAPAHCLDLVMRHVDR